MVNNKESILLGILIVVLLSNFVSAYGVTSSYWRGNSGDASNLLVMDPGETKDVTFRLQNMVGDEDIILRAEMVSGFEIARITDDNLDYLVPLGRKDVEVHIHIEIPENETIGNEYEIGVVFTQVPIDEGAMLQVGGAITKSIPVVVGDIVAHEAAALRKKKIIWTIVIIWVVIIIGLIVWLLFRRRKKKMSSLDSVYSSLNTSEKIDNV